MINEQAKHIAYVIHHALDGRLRTVEVTEAAEAQWVETIIARSVLSADYAEQCTPGYYNNEGQPSAASRQNGFFFGGPTEFVELLEQWRADGTMPGLERR
jgi:cyclohexanone monooxygenase